MPIYEYQCRKCGRSFDHLARNAQDHAKSCPACGSAKLQKALSAFVARAPTMAGKACDSCRTSPTCPSAGAGCGRACGR